MEKCFEYLRCRQKDCVMHEREDGVNCWEVKETLCSHPSMEILTRRRKNKCTYCMYYKRAANKKEEDLLTINY